MSAPVALSPLGGDEPERAGRIVRRAAWLVANRRMHYADALRQAHQEDDQRLAKEQELVERRAFAEHVKRARALGRELWHGTN